MVLFGNIISNQNCCNYQKKRPIQVLKIRKRYIPHVLMKIIFIFIQSKQKQMNKQTYWEYKLLCRQILELPRALKNGVKTKTKTKTPHTIKEGKPAVSWLLQPLPTSITLSLIEKYFVKITKSHNCSHYELKISQLVRGQQVAFCLLEI